MIKIELRNNKAYKWHAINHIYAKGYAFDIHNNYLEKESLVKFFSGIKNKDDFVERLNSLNGFFTIVIQLDDKIFGAVDLVRSQPLFIQTQNKAFVVTDVVQSLDKTQLDEFSLTEFISMTFTSQNYTLQKNVLQLLAGQYFVYDNRDLHIAYYYKHKHSFDNIKNEKEIFNDLDKISSNVFNRIAKSVKNKTLVIPLSGGYDSRYIATFIKNLHFGKVICYTYGKADSFEVNTSKKVAETLGFEWHFVEYNKDKWQNMLRANELDDFNKYASNYASLPVYQEFIAIKELKDKNLIPDNAVFLPGFSGDMLGGSLLPTHYFFNKEKRLLKINPDKYIFEKYFDNELLKINKKAILERIGKSYTFDKVNKPDDFVNLFEEWFMLQRIGKYINNALRIYEFFGYSWVIPLWDKELFEYWYSIPNKHRIQSKLYNKYLLERVFKPYKIDVKKADEMEPSRLRMAIKKMLPVGLIKRLRKNIYKITGKQQLIDINDYDSFAGAMKQKLEHKGIEIKKPVHINRLYALYTLVYSLGIDIKKYIK